MPIQAELAQDVKRQNENRLLWKDHDSPEAIEQMFMAEVGELWEAITQSFVDDDLTNVVMEIGDVAYLGLRHYEKYGFLTPKMLMYLGEVEDFCEEMGIDINNAVTIKLIRNSYKYADYIMSNGRPYEEATQVVKKTWKTFFGDVQFSYAYLEVLAYDA